MAPDCELCGVSFLEHQAFREHMQQHTAPLDAATLFECANCRRSFFSPDDLDRHGRRVHR